MPKPKRPAEHTRNISFPVWRTYIKICFTPDVNASIKWRDNSYTHTDTEAMCMYSDSASCCLVLAMDAPPAIIAHECWHAIRKMLANQGAELENEVIAYHLGYLVGEVHKFQASVRPRRSRK